MRLRAPLFAHCDAGWVGGVHYIRYFRRHSDFKDENEYRLVVVDILGHDSDYLYFPVSGALEFIILGDRFHDIYHNLIRDLANKYEAEAY